jgi:para-aminobenzoate synthetase component 1
VPVDSSKRRRPLINEVSSPLSAPEAFEHFKDRPFSFFLDSGMAHESLGRYSFIGSDPFLILKSRGNDITLDWGDRQERVSGNPFDVLGQMLERYSIAQSPTPIPFTGGDRKSVV